MANTYTQCYFQLVFAVKNREALISKDWKTDMEMYITGIVQNYKHKLLAIGTMPDHIHILIGYNLNQLIPDLVEKIKTSSNSWVNEKKLAGFKFEWQKGYGAFTYSRSQIDNVIKYVLSQQEHHKNQHFSQEYSGLLNENHVNYKDEYLFEYFNGIYNWD